MIKNNNTTYKGKEVERFAWWRFLKLFYVVVWVGGILWLLAFVYFAATDYNNKRTQNSNLSAAVQSGDIYKHKYNCETELSRSSNYYSYSTFAIQSCVEKKLGTDLPFEFKYNDPSDQTVLLSLLAFLPIVFVELARFGILYVIGVKNSPSMTIEFWTSSVKVDVTYY